MMTRNKARFLVTAALTTSALLGGAMLLSACGKLGTLEQAPPVYGDKAKSDWSTSRDASGGVTTTTSASASRDSERALPDGSTDNNKVTDPYRGNKKVADAPLEGFGNAESH